MTTDKFEWTDKLVAEYVNSLIPPLEQIGRGLINNAITGNKMEQFKASKLRKPILVTEDGKPQFEGDRPWYVTEKYHLGGAADLVNNKAYHPASNYKYFSTQEIAEQYIIENKPCLSVNDVMGLVMSPKQMPDYRANLIQLAKNKL